MVDRVINRRTALRGLAGAVAAVGASGLLSACGGDEKDPVGNDAGGPGPTTTAGGGGDTTGGGTSTSSAASGLKVPTRVPYNPVEPDLPELANGAPPAYLAYPAESADAFDGVPGSGGKATFLKPGDTPLPMPREQNKYWLALEKEIGQTLDIIQVVGSEFDAKLATTLAGGDLPDYVVMKQTTPHLAEVLKARFQDLSEWLQGDSIKEFKSLAALPTHGWESVMFEGGIWGVPLVFSCAVGSDNRVRHDILDGIGFDGELADGKEFLDLCKELTDVKKNRWALMDLSSTTLPMMLEMVGSPNDWRIDDGKFVKDYEAEEYKEGLGRARELWKAGYVYPDQAGIDRQGLFFSGRGVICRLAYTNWKLMAVRGRESDPKYRQGGLITPKWDGGGQAGHFLGSGVYTFTAIKQSKPERVKELLRIMDWFASPFGTQEYLTGKYGIPGHDYTLDGTDPVPTTTGTQEVINMGMGYLAQAPTPMYIPGMADVTKAWYEGVGKLMDATVAYPTAGLRSATLLTSGATINKNMSSLANDIMMGRKDVSAWDAGVKSWRQGGGDKIRAEFEAAYADRPQS